MRLHGRALLVRVAVLCIAGAVCCVTAIPVVQADDGCANLPCTGDGECTSACFCHLEGPQGTCWLNGMCDNLDCVLVGEQWKCPGGCECAGTHKCISKADTVTR